MNLTDGLRVRGRPTRSITARSNSPNCVKEAYDEDPDLATLIAAPYFRSSVESAIDGWRREVATATHLGIPIPASPRRCPTTTPCPPSGCPPRSPRVCVTCSAPTPTGSTTSQKYPRVVPALVLPGDIVTDEMVLRQLDDPRSAGEGIGDD